MISPAHVQLMARYNRWQNSSLYAAADTLADGERKAQRGAYFGSIHGTLSHLMFGDQAWMLRFTRDETFKPAAASVAASATALSDWQQMKAQRVALDARIIAWADGLTDAALAGDLAWHSMALGREVRKPMWGLVTHFFNHQTHHRGQVHCMLTQAGVRTEDTDLPFMPD